MSVLEHRHAKQPRYGSSVCPYDLLEIPHVDIWVLSRLMENDSYVASTHSACTRIHTVSDCTQAGLGLASAVSVQVHEMIRMMCSFANMYMLVIDRVEDANAISNGCIRTILPAYIGMGSMSWNTTLILNLRTCL